ncbi:MAG TPA: hypothetical protein VJP80_08270 [Candidatus Saccharimonadales bacterium]|nr:hypothetical protein [Candidatus Saccharimonadales bacterium]
MPFEVPSQADIHAATPDEIAEYVGPALDSLQAGRQPAKIFVPLRRLVLMSTVEIVAFKAGTEGEQVLLGKRGADPGDKWWVGMLNLPGSVILPNEDLEQTELIMSDGRPVDIGDIIVSSDLTRPSDRILRTEFQESVRRVAPVNELMRRWVKAPSGTENKTWVWTEVDLAEGHEAVIGGNFYDTQKVIDTPPSNLVCGHHYFVEQGLLALRAASDA